MAEMNEIVKLGIDTYRGCPEKYSVGESLDVLHKAFVDMNGGSTKLDYRAIRDGKCNGMFTIIEEILNTTIIEGLQGNEYFMDLVDVRNLATGDKNEFVVENSDLFTVSKAADGTQGIRRQRLSGSTVTKIDTTFHVVKIYDELNRVLSKQVDFNEFINRVGKSFTQSIRNEILTMWQNITATALGGSVYRPAAGSYNESTLLDVIEHVEAASGGNGATLVGTKKALRRLTGGLKTAGIIGNDVNADLYSLGYVGSFYGSKVVAVPQLHKPGSTDFVLDDDIIAVLATDDKPLKLVYEGEPIMHLGDPFDNADLTQDYLYGEKYGTGIVLRGGNTGLGIYEVA